MKQYYNNSWKDIVEMLQSDIFKGLSNEECLDRRKKYGDNKVDLPESRDVFKVLIKSCFSAYFIVTLAILIYLIYIGAINLSLGVGFVLLINLSLKLIYTNKKQKQIGELQKLNYSTVVVFRDGREQLVKSEELVKGDIVFYKKGSLIAADMRIIKAYNVKVSENNITGESFLKEKFDSKIDANISTIGEMKNILLKGSVIKDGEGTAIVIKTGNDTQFGRMLAMLTYASNSKHVLGSRIEKRLGKIIAIATLLAIGMYCLFSSYTQAKIALNLSLFSIGIVPVSILIFYYAKGLKRELEDEGIEIINMSTLALINDLDIIFLDKIGAITKEEMVVEKLFTNDTIIKNQEVNYNKDINVRRLIDILLLCNNATYNASDNSGKGDLLEVEYLRFAAKKLAYKTSLDVKNKRIFEVSMDSDKRFLSTLNKSKKGCRVNVKGNLDGVLERCTHIMINGIEKEIEQSDIEKIRSVDYNFSIEGLITQGVAYRSFSYQPTQSENIESNLVFVGIVALENPLNEGIENQIKYIRSRGILPAIFTEDNKITATTIGRKIGLIKNNDQVISGVEVSSLTKEELIEVLKKVRIFSRVTPEIKARIVGLFTKDNYKVAATGEDLSDLSLLSLSKLGIGKGKMPDIVKKICDIYIKENYLKGLFTLFDKSKDFEARLKLTFNMYAGFCVSQVILINILINVINAESNIVLMIIFIDILIVFFMILRILKVDFNKIEDKNYIVRAIIYNLILLAIYFLVEFLMRIWQG